MGSVCKPLLFCLLFGTVAMEFTRADVVVSGAVFCDRCKDGQMSFFDYPHYGVKVALACAGINGGQVRVLKEESTNWLGHYVMRLPGNPDISRCFAQVVKMPQGSWCGGSAGPARGLRLLFRFVNTVMYTAGPLLMQPAKAMAFCRPMADATPPPTASAAPVIALPPMPFFQRSACTYRNWTMPENKCNWRVVRPDTKVAVAFGLPAAWKYGTEMTLWEALHGKGDVYKALIREGTAALLNSFSSAQFEYPSLTVLGRVTWGLEGPEKEALLQAMRFRRANSGSGNVTCNLPPCT